MKTLEEILKKKDWTMEQWKNSEDIIDRTVYFISYLSPHNLWKGYEAIQNLSNENKCTVCGSPVDDVLCSYCSDD